MYILRDWRGFLASVPLDMNIKKLKAIIGSTKYRNWTFIPNKTKGGDLYVQVAFLGWDTDTHNYQTQHGRKWYISNHAVTSEVVGTLFKAVLTAEEHEARESFTYKGQPIFHTHYRVDALVDLCSQGAQSKELRLEKRKVHAPNS